FFRPNLWPNTPDILTEYLQTGGRPAFQARLILAATLGANYGIYGPPYEALEARARESGSEEYLDSEKYQVRDWKPDEAMRELISGARFLWAGERNYVEINPHSMPGQIFRFRRRVRSEHDFEYFL